VIASDVPVLRELVDDGKTGLLVPPGDVVQLARHMRLLLQDAGLRAQLGSAARQFVEARFPLAATIECWRNLYRAVAA
jgi:glycosyltransferase involved in cell wall biosynthesis